jgi:DNA-binding protein YbaB
VDPHGDVKARVDQMMAHVRRMTHEMGDVQNKLIRITGTASSADGLITATVGPRGHLISLEIDAKIYRRPDSALLAQTIVDTVRQAIEQASEEVQKLYEEFVPEEFGARKIMAGIGLPKDLMRQHDADVLKSREAQND